MPNNGTEQTAIKRPKNKREIITQVTFLYRLLERIKVDEIGFIEKTKPKAKKPM